MKASTLISIILALLAIIFSYLWFSTHSKNKDLVRENDNIKSSFEMATNTINEIQANLDSIEVGLAGQLFTSRETPRSAEDRKTQIINTIRDMKIQIETDKNRIAELEKKMANSQIKIRGLEDLVAKLKASIADKEKIVAELTGKLGIIQETLITERTLSQEEIAKRDLEIAQQQATIETQEKDINTIFYAFGTRKELIDNKIITREGGIIGLGQVSILDNKSELTKYKTLDLKEVSGISFPATRRGYSILTSQSAGSYKVDKVGDSYILKVLNKDMFRKYKILVIEIL